MPLLLRLIGKPSMPRGRTAIPITQPTNHRKTAPGAEHAKDNTRTEQGDRSRSLRHSLQQTRLRGSRTLLVAEVHPAQRAHRTRTRRTVRSSPLSARYVALRKPTHRRRRRLRHRARPFLRKRKARGLDCRRHCPIRRRSLGRALGRIARRSHTGRVRQRPSHVWRPFPCHKCSTFTQHITAHRLETS